MYGITCTSYSMVKSKTKSKVYFTGNLNTKYLGFKVKSFFKEDGCENELGKPCSARLALKWFKNMFSLFKFTDLLTKLHNTKKKL